MSWHSAIFWLAAACVGVGRFLVPGHDLSWPGAYEAGAHVWVGVAGLLWVQNARWTRIAGILVWLDPHGYGLVLAMLTVLETVMFLCR